MMTARKVSDPGDPVASKLSAEEITRATEIARRFDPRPCHAILQFGVPLQKRMTDLVALILASVQRSAAPNPDAPIVDMVLIVEDLRRTRQTLLADVAHFDLLYEEYVIGLREMLVYVRAGEIKLGELQVQLARSAPLAADGSSSAGIGEARDLAGMISALAGRVHDLKLAATITRQMMLQIRQVQSRGQALMNTIQNSLRRARASTDICSTVK
jgi:uncharacterized protein YaaN involved in tellurite resistance